MQKEAQLKQATATLKLRKARFDDGPFLLLVRNAEDVRSQSKAGDMISEETHRSWLQKHLKSSDSMIWIIEREEDRLGYIRAQKTGNQREQQDWLLSIALRRSARGQGYASWALREVCRSMRKDVGSGNLVAEVLASNVAACRLFAHAGFADKTGTADKKSQFVRLELALS